MQQKLVFIISLAFSVSLVASGDDLITKTCKSTPDIQICESSLRSDPRSSSADMIGLIQIMLDVVKLKFTDSLNYVVQLTKESPPPIKVEVLKNCEYDFRFVIDTNVKVAKSAVELGNPKFGTNAMRDSAVEVSICQDAVTGSVKSERHVDGGEGAKNELMQRTSFLVKLSNVAASMISVLE